MMFSDRQKLLWRTRADLSLHASYCNFVKKSLLPPLFPLINVEYHENVWLEMSTTNYIEQH